jgi:glycine oxidase
MSGGATVIVAGAGALGLTCALALADAGCAVTVCDPAPEAANASGVAAGMLAPAFETVLDAQAPHDLALLLAARDLWPGLAERAGVALDRSGAAAVGGETWLGDVWAGLARLGLSRAELGRMALDATAPGLSGACEHGVLTREDWRLEPRLALASLRRAALAAGVAFRAQAVRERGEADWLVAATGAQQALAPELAYLAPIKGHILRVRTSEVGRMTLRGEGVYAVPATDGLSIGGTMELGVADPAVDVAKGPPLRDAGARLFPSLAQAPFELLAGVRAATPDGWPLVGASSQPGVLVAAGARRNGWLLAPLVARTIAACVTGGDPGPYAARFEPSRFEERGRAR